MKRSSSLRLFDGSPAAPTSLQEKTKREPVDPDGERLREAGRVLRGRPREGDHPRAARRSRIRPACGSALTRYYYDEFGNLDVEAEEWAGGRTLDFESTPFPDPFAVSSLSRQVGGLSETQTFSYDADGNQTHAPGRIIEYTSFGLPRKVSTIEGDTYFLYDAFGSRVRKRGPSLTADTIGGLYERRMQGMQTTHVHNIRNSDRTVAQVSRRSGETAQTFYLHTDHVGSIESVTDGTGKLIDRSKFSPFGERRNPSDLRAASSSTFPQIREGFTAHSHDRELELIDMQGRIYDPGQRRFLSPDPVLGDIYASQTRNLYAYVNNNPLKYIDPSGWLTEIVFDDSEGLIIGPPPPPEPKRSPQDGTPIGSAFDNTSGGYVAIAEPSMGADDQPSPVVEYVVGGLKGMSGAASGFFGGLVPIPGYAYVLSQVAWDDAQFLDGMGVGFDWAEKFGYLMVAAGASTATAGVGLAAGGLLASAPSFGTSLVVEPVAGTLVVAGATVSGLGALAVFSSMSGKQGLKNRPPSSRSSGRRAAVRPPRGKPVNLPSWRKVGIDMDHIASGHMAGGSRASPIKDLFPANMSRSQIESAIRQAYRFGQPIRRQGPRALVQGSGPGFRVEMWVNTETKIIETAYPLF